MKANKNLGQHFLTDGKIIDLICTNYAEESKSIIEIGPGTGQLTCQLAKLSVPYFVIEKDIRASKDLVKFISQEQIIFQDALNMSLEDFIMERALPAPLWLVANLPYNISAPLLRRFLAVKQIKYMTLMFQKEVGEKIIGEKFSSLKGLCQIFFKVKKLSIVSPICFAPPPKVESIVLSFERLSETVIPLNELDRYEKFLRSICNFRRKQLGGILKPLLPVKQKLDLAQILAQCGIAPTARVESLNLHAIQKLYKSFRT